MINFTEKAAGFFRKHSDAIWMALVSALFGFLFWFLQNMGGKIDTVQGKVWDIDSRVSFLYGLQTLSEENQKVILRKIDKIEKRVNVETAKKKRPIRNPKN
jgi:hypothetical protein